MWCLQDRHEHLSQVHVAVRAGNRKLAAAIIKDAEASGGYGFNNYHREVFINTNTAY